MCVHHQAIRVVTLILHINKYYRAHSSNCMIFFAYRHETICCCTRPSFEKKKNSYREKRKTGRPVVRGEWRESSCGCAAEQWMG